MPPSRPDEAVFVGRKHELDRWLQVLADPRGQAVLVIGQQGMGKTLLVDKMAAAAREEVGLECGVIREEVTATETVDSVLAMLVDRAYEASRVPEHSLDRTPRRIAQWRALLNVIQLGDLVFSLPRDPQRKSRDQFLEKMELIASRLPPAGRAILIIDPEKYLQRESDEDWAIVIRRLPDKIKLIFPQRPDDVLATSDQVYGLESDGRIVRIPESELGALDQAAVAELVAHFAPVLALQADFLERALARYDRHPYAVSAALALLKAGVASEDLPSDPTPERIAAVQWRRVAVGGMSAGSGALAVRLFEAYAVLDVPVSTDVLEAVARLSPAERKSLLADGYLGALIRQEGEGTRIYHSILADHIVEQIGEGQAVSYHARAVTEYRARLSQTWRRNRKPDALAAARLPVHVLAAEGVVAFADCCVNECVQPLLDLGLDDTARSLAERALALLSTEAPFRAPLTGYLALIFQRRGDLTKAEELYVAALAMFEKIGSPAGVASVLGNLGLILRTRGELAKAEELFRKAFEISEKVGRLQQAAGILSNLADTYRMLGRLDSAEAMLRKAIEIGERLDDPISTASAYGNLGLVYKMRGNLAESERMLRNALEINERLGRPEGMADNYVHIGMVLALRGDVDEGEVALRKARDIFEKLGHLEGMSVVYSNLGFAAEIRSDPETAEQMYLKGLDIHMALGSQLGMATAYNNLGALYRSRRDLTRAEELFRRAFEVSEKAGYAEGTARASVNLGIVHAQRRELRQAQTRLHAGALMFETLGDLEGMLSAYENLALFYESTGDRDQVEQMRRKALEVKTKLATA